MALLAILLALTQDLDPLVIDEKAGQVTFGAKTLKTDVYPQLKGAIEYLMTMPGGKSYESCFETGPIDGLKLYLGLQKIGAVPGRPAAEGKPAEGGKLRITVEWKDGDKPRKEPIESFVHDDATQKPMEKVQWIFAGSKGGYVPEIDREGLLVLSTKNLMGLYQGDPTPLITNPTPLLSGNRYKANKALLPKEGTPVRIIIEVAK